MDLEKSDKIISLLEQLVEQTALQRSNEAEHYNSLNDHIKSLYENQRKGADDILSLYQKLQSLATRDQVEELSRRVQDKQESSYQSNSNSRELVPYNQVWKGV